MDAVTAVVSNDYYLLQSTAISYVDHHCSFQRFDFFEFVKSPSLVPSDEPCNGKICVVYPS